jgi:hypothetical protein
MAKAKSSTPSPAPPAGVGFGDKVSAFFAQGRLWRLLAGLVCVGVGLISLLTMLGLNAGSLLIGWTTLLQRAFGIGAWLVCVIAIGVGAALVLKPELRFTRRLWTLIIFGELAFFSFLALIHTLTFGVDAYQLTLSGGGGGAAGWVLAEGLWQLLGVQPNEGVTLMRLLSVVIWLVVFALSAFVVAAPLLQSRQDTRVVKIGTAPSLGQVRAPQAPVAAPALDEPTTPIRGRQLSLDEAKEAKKKPAAPVTIKSNATIIRPDEAEIASDAKGKGKAQPKKPLAPRPDTLPPMTLLKTAKEVKNSDADAKRQADMIETTLGQFGLAGKVVEIRRGPTVTQFGIEPGYLDRGAQSRDKALQKIRAAVAGAVFDAIDVEPSVDRTTVVVEAPSALVDAREANFRNTLKSLLTQLDLSTATQEGQERGRTWFELGADTERKLKVKASQISGLRRELASWLAERLFAYDDFAGSDMLVERLTVSYPNGIADAIDLRDKLEATVLELGLAGNVAVNKKPPQALIEWQKQAQKVRVGAIAALQNDIALALAAPSIRIEAPIPGRGLVGIEVPNSNIGAVDLRTLMEGESFRKIAEKSPLAIALGRDVSGTAINADLGRMPHMLIAGTTGSGKSVCISAITICLAMNNRPEDLKLVLIDPKMVELTRFAGLPHIIGKPESDMDRIPAVLRWVTKEMDGRYKKFAEVGSRNLGDYNEGMKRRNDEPLPRIVVLIDELADLMLQSPIETEKTICRLAQMARATGIHLVVATQRPSVDVVTGLIKANFPARIAFSVASATDSRVILDQIGAESLMGKGDMLFLNPEHGSPTRLQGCFVGDREVEDVIKWWKKQIESEKAEVKSGTPEADEEYVANKKPEFETPWEMAVAELAAERQMQSGGKGGRGGGGSNDDDGAADDDLIQKAMEIIRASGNVSTSLLQRKLRIGYPRAARLMEELQEMGYVGSQSRQAGKGRDVMMKEVED